MTEKVLKTQKRKAIMDKDVLLKAFKLMCTAKTLAEKYEDSK